MRPAGYAERPADVGPRAVHAAQAALLSGGELTAALPHQVRDSWLRCQAGGVDPEADPPVDLGSLEELREAHPLAAVMPVVRSLLVDHAREEGLLVAVTNAEGRLLWVEGAAPVLRKAERINFTSGARWGEDSAGTNAPALALAVDAPVRVRSAEHWARRVQRWSCSAAPLHDPVTGELLGALDVTGDGRAASSGALALVMATVAAVERELLLAGMRRGPGPSAGPWRPAGSGPGSGIGPRLRLRLRALGGGAGTLDLSGAVERPAATRRVSLRHAELLVLLAAHPEGLSAEALAVELAERTLDTVTIRAEMSRLRRIVGDDALGTRPYRLLLPMATDVDDVRAALDAGDLAVALSRYQGPLLPRSSAPGVVRMRAELAAEVRGAVFGRRDAELVLRWVGSAWGCDDLEAWSLAGALLPEGVARHRAAARATLLNQQLA